MRSSSYRGARSLRPPSLALGACIAGVLAASLTSCRKAPDVPVSTGEGGAQQVEAGTPRTDAPAAGAGSLEDPTPVIATTLVQSFEQPLKLGKWPTHHPSDPAQSTDWAVDGAQSLRLEPGLLAHFRELAVKDWSTYSVLRLHVKNTSDRTVMLGLELQDSNKPSHERHQDEIGVQPGVTSVDFDIAGDLWRGYEDFPYRGAIKTPLEKNDIQSIAIKNKGDAVVYVDQIEVLRTKDIRAAHAFAFDFGQQGSRVMRQMTGVFESTVYTPEAGYGFTDASAAGEKKSNSLPTPMLGDGLAWKRAGFRVDLPAGAYLGWVAYERGGFWGNSAASYDKASLKVNGQLASSHDFSASGAQFFFQDVEVAKISDMVDELVWPAHAIARFPFKATEGASTFTLDVAGQKGGPLRVAGLVIAPDTAEGRGFLDAHERLQRRALATTFAPLDRARRGDDRAPPAERLVVQRLQVGAQMAPGDWPLKTSPAWAPIRAALGQTVTIDLGVYARDAVDIVASGEPLTGPAGATIPAPAVSHGRYMPTRSPNQGPAWVEIDHYRPEPSFAAGPELARSVVFQYPVARDAKPGVYTGRVKIEGGGESKTVPVEVRVVAVALAGLPIPVGYIKNAPDFGPDALGDEAWWKLQEAFLKEQGDAGLNCVTGGEGLFYDIDKSGGKYAIGGDAPLRYLALAKKHGLDRAVIGYGGFIPSLKRGMLPLRDRTPAEPKAFTEALRAFEATNKLPPHYLYAYDEPSHENERRMAGEITQQFTGAGARTLGFTSIFWDEPAWKTMIDATYAPTLFKHDAKDLKKLAGMGKHPWLYTTSNSRFGTGLHLWRSIQLGAEGRLDWVGVLTNGFAFYELDGRSASDAAWKVHSRLGLLLTPRWLAAREGLVDLRVRLALERAVPKGDPSLASWTVDGYAFRGGGVPDAELEKSRDAMLARLEKR